eukprot:gene28505-31662_t
MGCASSSGTKEHSTLYSPQVYDTDMGQNHSFANGDEEFAEEIESPATELELDQSLPAKSVSPTSQPATQPLHAGPLSPPDPSLQSSLEVLNGGLSSLNFVPLAEEHSHAEQLPGSMTIFETPDSLIHTSPPADLPNLSEIADKSGERILDHYRTCSPEPGPQTITRLVPPELGPGPILDHYRTCSPEPGPQTITRLVPPELGPGPVLDHYRTCSPEPGPQTITRLAPPNLGPGPVPEPEVTKASLDDEDEDNWDQCSTSHFDLEGASAINDGTGGLKESTEESPADQIKDKVLETAKEIPRPSVSEGPREPPSTVVPSKRVISIHDSLSSRPDNNPIEYRETTTLRIDKVKGCVLVNQYLVVKFLGRGACGKVFLCLNLHDMRLYAMKAASQNAKKRTPMDDLKREIMIMRKMKHHNIVTLSEVINDPAGSKLLLVMEFMEGGPVLTRDNLEKKEKLLESLALRYFRDMLKALEYLHSHKVVHGDLKPENVLMGAAGDLKLSDFGCSKVFATGNEYLSRCNGTPAFLAPEMMKPNSRYKGQPADIYALGTCLYTLIFGRIPFTAPNLYKLFHVVQNDPVRYPEDVCISDPLRDILGAMLVKPVSDHEGGGLLELMEDILGAVLGKNPKDRITLNGLMQRCRMTLNPIPLTPSPPPSTPENPKDRITLNGLMQHPWVTKNGLFPLKPTRELKEGESQEKHSGLPGGTFQEVNPWVDHIAPLVEATKHERSFKEGDVIIRQGDAGGCNSINEGETQEKHSGLPGGTFQEVNPWVDHIAPLVEATKHERSFKEGDVIIRQGDADLDTQTGNPAQIVMTPNNMAVDLDTQTGPTRNDARWHVDLDTQTGTPTQIVNDANTWL